MPHFPPAVASCLVITQGTYLKVKPIQRELGRKTKIGRESGPHDIVWPVNAQCRWYNPPSPRRSWESHPVLLVVSKIWTNWNSLESSLALLIKTEHIHLPYDLAIPFQCIYLTEMPTYVHQRPVQECSQQLYSLNSQTKPQKQIICPSVIDWVIQLWCFHSMEYYTNIRMRKNQLHMQYTGLSQTFSLVALKYLCL